MPRPNTPVIPVNWSEHHQPTIAKTMTATVELRRPTSDKTFDETAGKSTYLPVAVLWTGSARVQRLPHRVGAETTVGGRFVTEQMYQVSLPLPCGATELQINDEIEVTSSVDDPTLVGKRLRIREIRLGSLLWSRDVICQESTPTTR